MSNSSYCQQNPITRQAGNQLSDRSAYLPFGTQYMVDQRNNPTMPSEWEGNIQNQAVFAPRGVNSLYFSTLAPGAALTNGFNTWLPNIVPPSTPTPVFNQAPKLSTGIWMVYDPPTFQYDHLAYCQLGQLASQPGFTPMCSDGTTPVCNVSGATGATGSSLTYGGVSCGPSIPTQWGDRDPLLVADKYTYAMRNKQIVNQETATNNGTWSNVAFDLSDCGGGVPCSCVDSSGMAVPGLAPLVTANSTMSNGLFSYSQQSCANGTPAMAATRKSQDVSASVPVYWTSFGANGPNVPDASQAVCPVNTMPACTKISANVVPDTSATPLYPLCNMNTDSGEKYVMVPLCSDTSVPVWNKTQFQCPGSSSEHLCPDGSQPTLVMRAKCDDGTAPSCISKPFCNAANNYDMGPTVPSGFQLKGYQSAANTWSYAGYQPGQNAVTPTCNYFGMKQTDICPCNCIVDSLGAPIAEGVPTVDQNGNIRCPANTEPDCTTMAIGAQCLDSNGNFLGALPTCTDGSRAYYDTTKAAVTCKDGSQPQCPSDQTPQQSGIFCLDSIANLGELSLEPVRCFSSIAGGVCKASTATAPIPSGGDNIVCPEGYVLSCPGVTNPTASSVCQGVNMSPVCIPETNACNVLSTLPDFGAQAIATPIDSRQTSNQSVVFCSAADGLPNSCSTILSHYFPDFQPPPGVQPTKSTDTQLLVPDPMTAGGLAQGVCLSTGNVIPSNPTDFTCALSTNPPTALTQWNIAGQGSLSAVPVGEPFALNKVNGSYPKELYFNNQGTGDYDHGLIYYLNQTCAQDSSGACTSSQMAGIPMAAGTMHCPMEGEKVKTVQAEGDSVTQFKAICEHTGVAPLINQPDASKEWTFPSMFSPNKVEACPADHVLTSLDETEPIDYIPEKGVWRGERTGRSAVCVHKSKAHDVKAAVGAAMPAKPCMNQPGINAQITYPGQGPVDAVFEYDPLIDTCRQKVVCQDGICDSNLQANSVVDYHQGLTVMNKAINYPAIFQNDSSFPVEMFGDLGQPGVLQKLNPSMVPIQPESGEAGLQVPEGYLYWPRNIDKTLQNQNKHAVGNVLYGYWTAIEANANLADGNMGNYFPQAFTTFDSTGAGWNQATQTLSKGTSADIYEDTYSPSVMGPLMSGAMTGNDTSQIGQMSRTIMPFYGASEGQIHSLVGSGGYDKYANNGNVQNMSRPWPLFAQNIAWPLEGSAVQISTSPYYSTDFPTWQLGFGRCDPCNAFYYQTADLVGGSNVPDMTEIPLFTLGNIPNDSSTSCTQDNFNASAMLGNVLTNSCSAANALNAMGVDYGNMPAYQCIAQCDGKQYIMSKYSWQGLNSSTNTPDQLCNPANVKKEFSGVCQSDDIFVWPVNVNQSNCVGC